MLINLENIYNSKLSNKHINVINVNYEKGNINNPNVIKDLNVQQYWLDFEKIYEPFYFFYSYFISTVI